MSFLPQRFSAAASNWRAPNSAWLIFPTGALARNKALADPAIVEKLETQGAQPDALASPEAFAQFARDDAKAMWQIVKQSGASIE